jgi:hypothetical protein
MKNLVIIACLIGILSVNAEYQELQGVPMPCNPLMGDLYPSCVWTAYIVDHKVTVDSLAGANFFCNVLVFFEDVCANVPTLCEWDADNKKCNPLSTNADATQPLSIASKGSLADDATDEAKAAATAEITAVCSLATAEAICLGATTAGLNPCCSWADNECSTNADFEA